MTESARRSADTRPPRPARPDIPGELTEVDDLAGWIERDNGGDLRVSHVLVRGDAAEGAESSFAYASVAKGKLEDVSVRSTDFSGADLAELRQRRVEFDDVRFAGTSFFRASLNGVDLSSCRLADIVLSDTMEELRGCSMDLFQAAGIARRLGVNVKD